MDTCESRLISAEKNVAMLRDEIAEAHDTIAQLRADLARVTTERDARLDMSPAMLGAVLEAYENGEEDVEHSDKCAVCEAVSAVREFVARSANAVNGGG